MASAETLREAKNAQPFRPFSLRLVDGTIYEVKQQDFISIPPTRRPREVLFYQVTGDDPDAYRERRIDLNLIMEVITVPSSTESGSDANGPG